MLDNLVFVETCPGPPLVSRTARGRDGDYFDAPEDIQRAEQGAGSETLLLIAAEPIARRGWRLGLREIRHQLRSYTRGSGGLVCTSGICLYLHSLCSRAASVLTLGLWLLFHHYRLESSTFYRLISASARLTAAPYGSRSLSRASVVSNVSIRAQRAPLHSLSSSGMELSL
jgi:hypothetical protein